MNRRVVALPALFALVAVAGAGGTVRETMIATWNPVGAAERTLKIKPLGLGRCGPGSDVIGDFGYRCGARNRIADPCWRDGPAPTERVVCTHSPWATHVWTIRVPHLMLAAGVTFAARLDPKRDPPWALELADGNHCRAYQGAHGFVATKHGHIDVDYLCDRANIVLLHNLKRGRVWSIGAAKWSGRRHRLLSKVAIRRAIFPSLPPAMQRQNDVARTAAAASRFALT